MQIIGATTIDEYRKHIEKDAALERRFQPVLVEEPTKENNNLLVYNYNAGTLLAPRTVKEEIEVSTNIIDEDKESKEEVNEEDTDVSTEEVVE